MIEIILGHLLRLIRSLNYFNSDVLHIQIGAERLA